MASAMNNLVKFINSGSLMRLARDSMLSETVAKRVGWFLLLLIIYMLAQFSWLLWEYLQPRQSTHIVSVDKSTSNKSAASLSIRQLMAFNLFGDSNASSIIVNDDQLDAPVTRLKLKLRGVYAASEEDLAGAMIEAKNKQEVYRVGNKLPGAAGLTLYKIMSDRVIMSRGGKFETLLIEDFGSQKNSNRKSNSRSRHKAASIKNGRGSNTIDKRNDRNLSREILKLRKKLSDPQSLSELVSVSPAMVNGKFEGFRIAPGKNRALFGRLGLRRNDLVTSVNGISLDDPASAFSLMEQMRTANEINLTIKRGDRDLNILFSAQSK